MKNTALLRAAVAALAIAAALPASARIVYVSMEGKTYADGGRGTEEAPYDIDSGFATASGGNSHEVVIAAGHYYPTNTLAARGGGSVVRGVTGDPADVILDARGQFEVMRLADDILVHSVTITNGITTEGSGGASGVRLGVTGYDGASVVSNCVITGCVNTNKNVTGGAVALYKNALLVDSIVRGNRSQTSGAGIYAEASGGTVLRCTIDGNAAVNGHGGGVLLGKARDLAISGTFITNNTSTGVGAGIALRVESSAYTLTLHGCTVANNSTPSSHGGGIGSSGGVVVARNCTFRGNTAGYGGAVNLYKYGRLVAEGCLFATNSATFVPSSIGNTKKVPNGGGAILCRSLTTFAGGTGYPGIHVTNCVFQGNSSAVFGGAISHDGGNPMYGDLVNCTFLDNSAVGYGGAVFLCESAAHDGEPFLVRQCLFAGNKAEAKSDVFASANGGALYYVSYDNPVIDSCTIVNNEATTKGGALYHKWGGVITNSIIAFNTVNGAADSSDWGQATANAYNCVYPDSHSSIQSSYFTAARGNIFVDPKFVDAANGDYRLADDSPCKNAGVNEAWMATTADLAGLRSRDGGRIYGENVDIGAYEIYIPAAFMMTVR